MVHFDGSSTYSVAVEVSGYLSFTRDATEELVIHDPDEAFGFNDVETYVSEEILDEEKDEIEYSVHFSGKHFLAVNVQDRGSISEAVNKAMEGRKQC